MKVTPLGIDGAWFIESPTFPDDRGLFREWFLDDLDNNLDIPKFEVKQANTSISTAGVIRGIHYSSPSNGQTKLVTCTFGLILDAIVDFRENSDTFGKSITIELSSHEGHSIYISRGLGHGFQALSDKVAVTYLLDKKYEPELEFGIDPLDSDLAINWKSIEAVVSEKDRTSPSFSDQKSRGFQK